MALKLSEQYLSHDPLSYVYHAQLLGVRAPRAETLRQARQWSATHQWTDGRDREDMAEALAAMEGYLAYIHRDSVGRVPSRFGDKLTSVGDVSLPTCSCHVATKHISIQSWFGTDAPS